MTAAPAYTNDQLLAALDLAIKARDMPAVADLLRALAVQSPDHAQAVMDMLELAGAGRP